jgi:hypothetical protein
MKSYKYVDRINDVHEQNNKLDNEDLIELKRIRNLDRKCWSILKEVFVYIVFIVVLYVVTFSNLSNSAMRYNHLFQSNFVEQQSSNEIGLYDVRILSNYF